MRAAVRVSLLASLLAAGVATAQPLPAQPLPAQPSPAWRQPAVWESPAAPPPSPRGDNWQAAMGVRSMLIKSAGYDPFSTRDGLAQFSLSISRVAWRQDRLSFVLGLGLDTGSASSIARSAPSDLSLTTWSLVAEGRYRLHERVSLLGRLAPGLQSGEATLSDSSSPTGAPLATSFTTPSVDASVGGAVCLTGSFTKVGAWLLAEGGYGWAPASRLLLAPGLGDRDQSKAGALDLGTIAPRGPFMRFAFALSY